MKSASEIGGSVASEDAGDFGFSVGEVRFGALEGVVGKS